MLRRTFLLGCGGASLFAAVGPTPAAPQSGAYSLSASPEGEVYLVWIETKGDGHALRISRLEGDSSTLARTIRNRRRRLLAHWIFKRKAGPSSDEIASRRVLRLREKRVGVLVRHDTPLVQQSDAVREPPNRRQIVRDEENRSFGLYRDGLQKGNDAGLAGGIESRKGFIQDEKPWIRGNRPGDDNALTFPA